MASTDSSFFARFANERKKLTKDRVHPKLFQPPRNLKLSVEAIDGKDRQSILEAGKRFASQTTGTLYGWAKLTRKVFEEAGLIVCVDNEPHCGHTTICGWGEDRNSHLDKQKRLAKSSCKVWLSQPVSVDLEPE